MTLSAASVGEDTQCWPCMAELTTSCVNSLFVSPLAERLPLTAQPCISTALWNHRMKCRVVLWQASKEGELVPDPQP